MHFLNKSMELFLTEISRKKGLKTTQHHAFKIVKNTKQIEQYAIKQSES